VAAGGLDTRPANPACLAPARDAGPVSATWLDQDIGPVLAAGNATVNGTSVTVRGAGADIWGNADEFHFAHRTLTGDGDVVARVASLTNTDPWAKAGVMLRESLAANSRFALMLMTPGSTGAAFHYRTSAGGNAAPPGSGDGTSTLPRWVKISRRGNLVSGYTSTDGATWTLRDSVTLALPATVYAGLAVTSHQDGTLATGVFSSVQVTGTGGGGGGPGAGVALEDAFPAMPAFTQPTKALQAPGDPSRWFVLEKTGRVRVFRTDTPATVATWLDFSSKVNPSSEGGLLGLAFHPLYPARREVFVSYTTGSPMRLVLSRLLLDNVTAPATVTEQVLLTADKPWDNHNGGEVLFGADNYLYLTTGDGGSGGDPDNYAQDLRRLLGKVLRIDAWDSAGWPTTRYGIPPDNPYASNPRCGPAANGAPCPELYAWGLRNPWRASIDPASGALWVGDVGQDAREEIDIISRGGNYGWRCREGTANYNTSGCPGSGFVAPVFDYAHGSGNGSITGGAVYRGSAIPALRGRYVYGDFLSGRVWALADDGAGGYTTEQLVDSAAGISAFATDAAGELYVVDYGSGRLQRLVNAGGAVTDPVPDDLAATGCVVASNPRQAAPGVIPFTVNAPFWSDGAAKVRHLAVPDGQAITIGTGGDWDFPAGSVLMKTMELGGRPVETRLFMRHPDGGWAGYTYEWNDAGTAATRVRGGKVKFVQGQDWIYPSEGECLQCHTGAAGFSLGPETAQLNGTQLYPATGRTANQLETLSQVGLLLPAVTNPASRPRLPSPADTAHTLNERARAYLHANCANCHRPGGPTGMAMDLRWQLPLDTGTMQVCNAPPQAGDLGIANARLLAPGSPARSILLQRMLTRDAHGMPPLASSLPDTAGANLVSSWISGMSACDTASGGCHVTTGF
ncbi:MAG: PQQ-dependent sugar dehydrogenase, partial [Gammaproteobacteria bacterium]|nr:PQQ-dependent sugar dehydrogenase [Gammaproteobacteria bacterium]